MNPIPTTALSSAERVPILGQGTWMMGEDARRRKDELAALRLGLDLGLTLIDTAEMYGEGAAEELIAEAVAGRRDGVFLVSKFYPQHATRREMRAACDRSLKRLRTDRIDLYLLHWRGSVPLEETLRGFDDLMRAGKIRFWGASNFDIGDMVELVALPGGATVATNQVLYNLKRRGIEWNLLPWCGERRIPIMAYSPVEQGRLLKDRKLKSVAARHNVTPAQIALAWVLRDGGVITIPKAGNPEHVRANRAVLDLRLTAKDLTELDKAFPPPKGPRKLEML